MIFSRQVLNMRDHFTIDHRINGASYQTATPRSFPAYNRVGINGAPYQTVTLRSFPAYNRMGINGAPYQTLTLRSFPTYNSQNPEALPPLPLIQGVVCKWAQG
jgi:hypothetical protein